MQREPQNNSTTGKSNLPPQISSKLQTFPSQPCPYLPDRTETLRALFTIRIDPLLYHDLMNASFRRSGCMIYQPICHGCRECIPLRVPVATFRPSKSQRRCLRRNADLTIDIAAPDPTLEKYDLYTRYQTHWHARPEPGTPDDFIDFLYQSPVNTIEFTYRDPANRLLAVGICDICAKSLSSVYFYFEPEESRRALGTFGALCEIQYAAQQNIDYVYLGFWVKESAKMAYKADFKPCEILQSDGSWQLFSDGYK